MDTAGFRPVHLNEYDASFVTNDWFPSIVEVFETGRAISQPSTITTKPKTAMKKNNANVTVIVCYFLRGSIREYITGHIAANHLRQPRYSTKINEAMPFLTAPEAEAYCAALHNPFNRIFHQDTIEVSKAELQPAKRYNIQPDEEQ